MSVCILKGQGLKCHCDCVRTEKPVANGYVIIDNDDSTKVSEVYFDEHVVRQAADEQGNCTIALLIALEY